MLASSLSPPEKNSVKSPRLQGKINGFDANTIELALDKMKSDIDSLQKQNRKKIQALKMYQHQSWSAGKTSRTTGTANGSVSGPGAYNVGTCLEFIRNTHSFNITNNILYGEIDKIKSMPLEEEKKVALELYRSPVLGSVLNPYSHNKTGAIKSARQRSRAERIRASYMSARKSRERIKSERIMSATLGTPPEEKGELPEVDVGIDLGKESE